MILFIISFLAGILTVLAPCTLPFLPVIVGGSISDGTINKRKAFTVVTSLGISVIAFTLLLKASTLFINIPQYTWTIISGGIVLILGIITLFPALWENQLVARMSTRANMLLGQGDRKHNFWGDVIVGAALGPVFSTCSPTYFIILATVLPVQPLVGLIYLIAYVVGLGLSLFAIAFIGQKIITKLGIVADSRGTFKKVLGILFIIIGVGIIAGWDKKLESGILESGFFDITKIEQRLLEKQEEQQTPPLSDNEQPDEVMGTDATSTSPSKPSYFTLAQKTLRYKQVPELSSIDGYINTDGQPITLESLRGKVVLLDIWTYSCINCQRTIPYLNEWYEKYHDQGLEIVGLHTPEFSFEKVQSNVANAVEKFGINYPVVLDNDFSTWNALGNRYWPRKYLIDMDGYIVYDHAGEGSYDETERAIQRALQERAERLQLNETISSSIASPETPMASQSIYVNSPETYFGSARNNLLANGTIYRAGKQSFTLPETFARNKLYLGGTWDMTSEYAETKGATDIVFSYDAKNVYFVASSQHGTDIEIYRDDIFVQKIHVQAEQLYQIIAGSDYGAHTLHIKIPDAGLRAFTFTFG